MKPISQRQKVLMAVLSEMSRNNRFKTFLQKALFLLKQEEKIDMVIKFYSFYPYNYGPFSYRLYEDLSRLQQSGFITEDLKLTNSGQKCISTLPEAVYAKVKAVTERFSSVVTIRKYVYEKYPKYTVKSKLRVIKNQKPEPGIFTIGYEGKDIDSFLDILIENKIETVVDIRFNPFSMNFDFTQLKLQTALAKSGIEYIHMKALGIEGSLRKNLNNKEDYTQLFDEYKSRIEKNNTDDIKRLIELGKTKRIALLCFECDKDMCHRGVVSKKIEKEGIPVCHMK